MKLLTHALPFLPCPASSRSCSSSPNLPGLSLMSRKSAQESNDLHNQDQALSSSPLSPSTLASAFSASATFIPQANVHQVPSIVDLSLSTSVTSQPIGQESTDYNPEKPTASRQQHRDTPPTVSISKSSTSQPGAKPLQFINNLAPVVPRPKPTPSSLYIQTQSAVQQKLRKQLREEGKIKRSSNCFIMYRTHIHPLLVARYGNQNNKEISRLAGRCWRNEPESVKSVYRQQAHQEKLKHASLYPAYKYTPTRSGQSSSSSSFSVTKDKEKVPVTLLNNTKNEKEDAKVSKASSITLSKHASTNPASMKGQERNTDLALQISPSASAALASSYEQQRGKKKRPNPDQSSSTSKRFHVTETALYNFTGDTVPDSPVAKKPRGARPKQSVTIPGLGPAAIPVSIAGALPNTFAYDFSFHPCGDTSLSLDTDQTSTGDPQSLNSNARWGAETMSASLTFNPLFLNGTIDSNDVWSPAQTSSPALTTPLLDLPLGTADFPWFHSPPLTTPTLDLSSPLSSTAMSRSTKQITVSSFPAVGFGTTIAPRAAMAGQNGNHMSSLFTQSTHGVSPNLAWGFESVPALSAVSPPLSVSYSGYTSMSSVSNDMPFGLASSATDVVLGITNQYAPSHLSAQSRSSSMADNTGGNWIPATSEQILPATAWPLVQRSWVPSPLSPLPSSAANNLSNTEHSGPRGSSYTPITVSSAPVFQLFQKSASSGNSHSSQLQHPLQQLQLQQTQQPQLSSPYTDITHATFQWTVPERHSNLVQSDNQLLYTDIDQKTSGSNRLLETIGSAGSGGGTTASAVMALALAANDHHVPQQVGMSSRTLSSTSFFDQTCQQHQQPLQPPLLQQLISDGNHDTENGKRIDDGNHSNGTDSDVDGDGESEEELSKSIEFYERIVQQQKMRLSLQRQLKSTTSGDLLPARFRQHYG